MFLIGIVSFSKESKVCDVKTKRFPRVKSGIVI